jgi:hypothetical protein
LILFVIFCVCGQFILLIVSKSPVLAHFRGHFFPVAPLSIGPVTAGYAQLRSVTPNYAFEKIKKGAGDCAIFKHPGQNGRVAAKELKERRGWKSYCLLPLWSLCSVAKSSCEFGKPWQKVLFWVKE